MQKPGLIEVHNVVQFVLEIDKLKGVLRRMKSVGEDRYENTAAHSCQIAIFANLSQRLLRFLWTQSVLQPWLLVHDLGEIAAGDTFVFSQDGWQERKAAYPCGTSAVCTRKL